MTDQELIQALQMCSMVRCPDCLKEHTVCYRRKWMADASTRLETLLAENKQLCWIPVTERLPDKELWEYQKKYDQDNMEVLVMIKGAKEATTLYYDSDGDFNDENGESWLVTHWQPMPKPPKEEHHG